MAFGGVGVLYLVALLLQVTQGRSALAAGLLLLPATVPLALGAPLCAGLARRVGWRPPMVLGMSIAAGSGVLLLAVSAGSPPLVVGLVLLTLGVGLTLNTAPMVGAAMAIAPPAARSVASAANNAGRQVGAALGVAVLGSLAGNPAAPTFAPGLRHAGLVAAAAWVLAAVLATRAPAAPMAARAQVRRRTRREPVAESSVNRPDVRAGR
jgi:DHA2 family methylenomycin A resistance protein-like MFS transporter